MSASRWLMQKVLWKMISLSKRIPVNIWHLQCSWHQAVCITITHHNRAGGLCPVNSGGHCSLCSHDPFHSQGECEDHKEPNSQEGSSQIIPRWAGNLAREVIPGPTQQDADNCAVNLVIVPWALNITSARALNICGAMGMLDNCGI